MPDVMIMTREILVIYGLNMVAVFCDLETTIRQVGLLEWSWGKQFVR